MLLLATTIFAQQEQTESSEAEQEANKKKPSWSTGLPERKAAPSMNKPNIDLGKPDVDLDRPDLVEMPSTDVAIDRESFAIPEISIEPATPTSAVPPVAKSSSRTRRTVSFDASAVTTEEEPEMQVEDVQPEAVAMVDNSKQLNGYDWEILKSEPIKIPKSLSFSYKDVKLEVHINPEGKVVKVKRLSDLTSNLILNYSTKTLKKWQFRPPAEFGISEVIQTNMVVDLVAR